MEYYGKDIYYQEKNEFIKSTFAWSLLFIAISLIFLKDVYLTNMILRVIRLLVIITLLMFINHSENIIQKPIQKVAKVNTIIIIIISIMQFVKLENSNIINYCLNFFAENNNIDHSNVYVCIMYYMLSKYYYGNSRNIISEYKMILTITIVLNIISNYYVKNIEIISVIYAITIEAIMVMTIKNIFKHEVVANKKINVLKISIINFFIYINLIEILGVFGLNRVYLIVQPISFAIFVASLTIIIDNIPKNMYSFIFKDIHNKNEELEKINYEIMARNEELEKSKIEIEKKHNEYRTFLNLLPKAIIIVSTVNNRIIYCNPNFQKLVGANSIRDILNKKVENIVSLDFNYKDLNNINRECLYFGRTIKNNIKQLEIRLTNYNENIEEITITFEDITEKIKIEKIKVEIERKRINDNIKKDFLSNMSHDFKIPINVIYSAIQLENLLILNNDIKGVEKYNAISKQNCLTLIRLTNNIIDMSKISSEYVNPILIRGNIVEFIEDRVSSLIVYAKLSNIDIIFDTNEEELYMKYDRELMERIILNLISNAIKFTPKEGRINVSLSHNQKNIFISVEDTGCGMDEKFAKEAFNRYSMNSQDLYKNFQGTGVGLYVVYNLVNLQKGEISVSSKVGEGTKFTMKFYKE